MTAELVLAAAALAEMLEAENAALRDMDVRRAVARFPCKAECARRLGAALARVPDGAPEHLAAARASVARLRTLVEDNRRLLERAMFVQGRLIATLARARPPALTGYGRAQNASRPVPPMTLSARA